MAKDVTIKYTKKVFDKEGNPVMETDAEGKTSQAVYNGEVVFKMPEGVEAKVQAWGEDVVDSKCEASVIIDIQRICRAADSVEEAQSLVDKFVPGVARERSASGISQKALMEALKGVSKDKLAELIASLKGEG